MNIDDLKSLMDEFDPAALLPEIDTIVGKAELVMRIAIMVGPIILMVMGLMYLFASPKEANYYFGYRCYYGMGSIYAWRFTQRFAGVILGLTGLILSIVMFTISARFAAMDVTDMVWKALSCLVWQAVITFLAHALIHLTAAWHFDRKGRYRRKKKKTTE